MVTGVIAEPFDLRKSSHVYRDHASSATAAPTGTVSFLDGGAQIGTGTLTGNPAIATFTTSTLMVGTHTITASYAGDSYNAASNSQPVSQKVNQDQTSTAVSRPRRARGLPDGPETITATVQVIAGAGTPTGTVTFTSGGTQLGSAHAQQRNGDDHSGASAGQLSNCGHI